MQHIAIYVNDTKILEISSSIIIIIHIRHWFGVRALLVWILLLAIVVNIEVKTCKRILSKVIIIVKLINI